MKINFLICFSFLVANIAVSQCYGPEFYEDIDNNGFWTANEWDTNDDGVFNEDDETPYDCNGNGTWDANGCEVDCDVELKVNAIIANSTGSGEEDDPIIYDGTYNVEIYYKSNSGINGYQFRLRSDTDNSPGVHLEDALLVSGAVQENGSADLTGTGFTISSGSTALLAFSFTGATIPSSVEFAPLVTLVCNTTGDVADGVSVVLDAFNNSDSGLVVSDENGGPLKAQFYDAVWSVGDVAWDANELGSLDNDFFNPYSFSLSNNYPNPFNPSTNIDYSIAEISDVNIAVYDASGRFVKNLVSSQHVPGDSYQVTWNGTNEAGNSVAAGMYFYKINAGSFVETKKMLLIK